MAIQLHPMRVEFDAVALLVGRICFASDFLLFGSRKLANPSIIYNLIEARHLPGELVYRRSFCSLDADCWCCWAIRRG